MSKVGPQVRVAPRNPRHSRLHGAGKESSSGEGARSAEGKELRERAGACDVVFKLPRHTTVEAHRIRILIVVVRDREKEQ
jgi:hypothetical protein